MSRIYVASPLGFSKATQAFYRHTLLRAIRDAGLSPRDPWANADAKRTLRLLEKRPLGERRKADYAALNRRVGEYNAQEIHRAHAVLGVLDGADVDSGTAAEIGFAAAEGKPIVGLRLDSRQTGDNEGATVNLQVEYFIELTGGSVVSSVAAATRLLSQLVSNAPTP